MHSRRTLAAQFRELGVRPGAAVMLHASVRAVGRVAGGPDEIHLALEDAISPGGTILMYAGCQDDFALEEPLGGEAEWLLAESPVFDPATARSVRDHGALVEMFRTWPGTVSSSNPGARIAARGERARWFAADHPLQYGYGPGSPFEKLCECGGQVLLLGSDRDQVTLLHYAEHIAPVPNKRTVRYRAPLLVNGVREWCTVEEFDTGIGIRDWPERLFARIVDAFLASHAHGHGSVGEAASYLLDAAELVRFASGEFAKEAGE